MPVKRPDINAVIIALIKSLAFKVINLDFIILEFSNKFIIMLGSLQVVREEYVILMFGWVDLSQVLNWKFEKYEEFPSLYYSI
jgi:hypothetical protein